MDAAVLEFFLISMFLIPLYYNDEGFTITWKDLATGMAAGLLMAAGRTFVTIGVAIGPAGPVEAIRNTHALY